MKLPQPSAWAATAPWRRRNATDMTLREGNLVAPTRHPLAWHNAEFYDEAAIRELHSYEEPEIVATRIVAGSAGYLAWIGESLAPDD